MKYIVLFLFSFSTIYAQNSFKDSISDLSLKQLDKLTIKLENSDNKKKGIIASKILVEKSKKEKNLKYRSRGYYSLSNFYEDYDVKLAYADSMLFFSEQSNIKYLITDALCLKANINIYKGNYSKGMELLASAYKYAIEDENINNQKWIESRMGSIKNQLSRFYEAKTIYKNAYLEYKSTGYDKVSDKEDYLNTIYNLSLSFSYLDEYDSTLFYAKKGSYLLEDESNPKLENLFKRSQAIGLLGKGKLEESINLFHKTLAGLSNNNQAHSYYYIASAHKRSGRIDSSIAYYKKVDSVFHYTKAAHFPGVKTMYKDLFQYYQSKEDFADANIYLNKYFAADSSGNQLSSNVGEKLHRLYDLPRLKIQQEEKRLTKKRYRNIIKFLTLILIVALVLIIYQRKKNKKQKVLVQKYLSKESDFSIFPDNQTKRGKETKKAYIKDDTALRILKGLEEFETNQGYLDKNVTQESLSKILETNSTNLSKIINTNFEITFPTYLKRLRVDNALKALRNNPKLLKFSINGLAEEFGFKNPDTFSRNFKEITKVKPSIFIEELKKFNSSSDNL